MSFFERIAQWIYPPSSDNESEDKRLNRAILVLMASATSLGGLIWGTVYLALGVPEVSWLPYGYVLLSFINLAVYLRTKEYTTLLYGQLFLILIIPSALQWAIGGFGASGAVMLWAFLSPSVALVVSERRRDAMGWFIAFFGIVLISGFMENRLALHDVGMPQGGVNAFFVLNFFAPLMTTYYIVYYFIGAGRKAQVAMREQAAELEMMNTSLSQLAEALEENVRIATLDLRSALSNLSAIINSLVDGLIVTDMDGKITNFNPTMAKMFNLKADVLMGRRYQDTFHPDMVAVIDRARQSPQEAFSGEVALANERIGNAASTAILVDMTDDDESEYIGEQAIGTVTLIRDITREKELDQMKTDFISTVSHELRTPLTSVLGFAKIIKKRLGETVFPAIETDEKKTKRAMKQVDSNLDIIISEGERLTALINDVLDIAKMEAGRVDWNMQKVALPKLMEHAIASTSSLFENNPNVTLVPDIAFNVREVMADSDRILQVMINLISNASKFTDEGTVTCRVHQDGDDVIVSVTDTGMGIAPEDQPKVFERFKQVGDTMTDKPAGTGLGLPICQQIVEHHGGNIWVESEIGKGSTFAFRLKAYKEENTIDTRELGPMTLDSLVERLKAKVANVPTAAALVAEAKPAGKEILVVDDESHIRELLRQELEGEGYTVREAKDGVEAMQKVKEHRPDLIILDVMMPNVNGFDLLTMLKTDIDTMNVPTIILSIVEDKERGFRLGVDRYLTKPLNTERLFNEVSTLLNQGTSKKRVMIVDDNAETAKTLEKLLLERDYQVVEMQTDDDFVQRALSERPHIIVANANSADRQTQVKSLRHQPGLEDVYILLYEA